MKRLLLTGALVASVLFGATAALADGPQCTITYPRGFTVSPLIKKTKKHTLKLVICQNGDLESTWGRCTSRYKA